MNEHAPALSIGLAVRNGRDVVGRCIESVLSQDFADLELVVSDNVSDDGTVDMLEEYARADRRVTVSVNPVNIGVHENMKRVLQLARGRLFRWISSDDWLEPGCLSRCVQELERWPEAVGVTTRFAIHTPDGATRFENYRGEFPTSENLARRFERMLWFFHAGDGKYDPIYGVYRREAIMRSHPMRPSERTDWLLSAELALKGPIVHIPQRLANRTRDYAVGIDRAAFRRRLDPVRAEELRSSPNRLYHELLELVMAEEPTADQLRRCKRALRIFWVKEAVRMGRLHASDARYRMLKF